MQYWQSATTPISKFGYSIELSFRLLQLRKIRIVVRGTNFIIIEHCLSEPRFIFPKISLENKIYRFYKSSRYDFLSKSLELTANYF